MLSVSQRLSKPPRGIYKHGLYNFLGAYYANSVREIAKKIAKRDVNVNPYLALEVFNAYYLLNLDKVEPLPKDLENVAKILKPVEDDTEVREVTVLDDKISRIAAAKFIVAFEEEFRRVVEEMMRRTTDPEKKRKLQAAASMIYSNVKELTEENIEQARQDFHTAYQQISSDRDIGRDIAWAVAHSAIEASREARETAMNAKASGGLLAGVGHSLTFDDLSWVENSVVDLRMLLKLFNRISILFERAMIQSKHGELYGRKYGRDIQRAAPSALSMDDDEFYIRYAMGTLPIEEFRTSREEPIVVVVDKSGSMDRRNKTLWSRAVALALGRLAAKRFYSDAKLIFFDYNTYPSKPISLKSKDAIKLITSIRCSGGTSIDTALKTADDGKSTIVLITDGEDSVSYKPKSRLISVMIDGHNEKLASISDRYLKVEPDERGALKILDALKEERKGWH